VGNYPTLFFFFFSSFQLPGQYFFRAGLNFSDDICLTLMADSLGNLTHLTKFFSTCPAKKYLIFRGFFSRCFTGCAHPLRYLINREELLSAGPTEDMFIVFEFIPTF
jgi:hypothetical protein